MRFSAAKKGIVGAVVIASALMSSASFEHESYVRLFKDRPMLAAELLSAVFGAALGEFTEVSVEDVDLTVIEPAGRYADAVVVLKRGGSPIHGVIVEVQLDPDEEKPFAWPMYLTTARARFRCPFDILVFTPKPSVARWAARRIELGCRSSFEPFVIGPDGTPVVTDPEIAERDRELAVLSAMAHGKGPVDEAVRIALAALEAVRSYPDSRALLYSDMILAALSPAARAKLEELMAQSYEFQSDFARRHRAQARAEDILAVLEARGLTVSDDQRARIQASMDFAELDRWVRRAATITRTDELFAE